jgi:hypothetical protein
MTAQTFMDAPGSTGALPTGLYGKLAKISGELSWVDKTGYNEAQKYQYVKAEDIANAVRAKLAEHGIAFIPEALETHVRDSVTGKQHVTTVKMRYLLVDSETGQSHLATWYGTGADSGDKGLLKAYTAAQKYFFIDLFQIPTGKDPDQEAAAQQQRAKAGEAKLSGANIKKIIDAVIAAGVTDEEWSLFRTSLGVSNDLSLTSGHAKQIRAWLDGRAKT